MSDASADDPEGDTDPVLGPKASARVLARLARASAHAAADPRPALESLVHEAAARCPRGGIIAGYSAIRTELDPRPALERLHGLGFRICLPVVEARAMPLRFRPWAPGAEMVVGAYGAMIPADDRPVAPDLVVVPLLAFDARGYRLGYGGGFYDRTLQVLRAQRPVSALGLAYGAQQVASVPVEATDQPLDAVITETGVITPR